jgi:hypothetical protein
MAAQTAKSEKEKMSWYEEKIFSEKDRMDALRKERFFRPNLLGELERQLANVREEMAGLSVPIVCSGYWRASKVG